MIPQDNHSNHQTQLTERQRKILNAVVYKFIEDAAPVGSRSLSRLLTAEFALSPATIRNEMADLEEMGYIQQPHTSAGRLPTDKGYRFYVNQILRFDVLSDDERSSVQRQLRDTTDDQALRNASMIIGALSHHLAIVEIPLLSNSIIHKIDVFILSSNRLLIALTLESDVVRTITLEINFSISATLLDETVRKINDRISGRPLKFVRENIREVISDMDFGEFALIRLFVDAAPEIFAPEYSKGDKFHVAGTKNLLEYPEFEKAEQFKRVFELLEQQDTIVHLLENQELNFGEVDVLIGEEMEEDLMDDYSLVTTPYSFPSASGVLGLIGPKRMNYSRTMSVVRYVAHILSQK